MCFAFSGDVFVFCASRWTTGLVATFWLGVYDKVHIAPSGTASTRVHIQENDKVIKPCNHMNGFEESA